MLSKELQSVKRDLGKLPDRTTSLGYDILYTTDFGNIICDECAILVEKDPHETLLNYSSYLEGEDIECDECGEMISSSYG